jgi:hypothetical protein
MIEFSSQALVLKRCFELMALGAQIAAEAAHRRAFALSRRDSPPNRAAAVQNCCSIHPRKEK